ncbi:Exosome component 5 [Chytriomyces hyalinus]|nr:Exosome component 5 [Chytriomyces hyalinus]
MVLQRSDGRTDNLQLRPPTTTLSPLSRADGSARFAYGKSAVLAAVYGPKEVRLRDELLDSAKIEVLFRPLVGLSGTTERLYEKTIREILESVILKHLHPRTSVQILSCAINATILALMDAGVGLKSMVASVTCIIDDSNQLVLDPSAEEIKGAKSVHVFTFDNVSKDVTSCVSTGVYTYEQYKSVFEVSQSACASVQAVYRQTMENKVGGVETVDEE